MSALNMAEILKRSNSQQALYTSVVSAYLLVQYIAWPSRTLLFQSSSFQKALPLPAGLRSSLPVYRHTGTEIIYVSSDHMFPWYSRQVILLWYVELSLWCIFRPHTCTCTKLSTSSTLDNSESLHPFLWILKKCLEFNSFKKNTHKTSVFNIETKLFHFPFKKIGKSSVGRGKKINVGKHCY